jgi:hypothetical protein
MTEYVVRFLVGGVVASAFAMLGDVLRPRSFAGAGASLAWLAVSVAAWFVRRKMASVARRRTAERTRFRDVAG